MKGGRNMWNRKIRTKIFLAMLLASALPLLITSTIVYFQISRSIQENQEYARNRISEDLLGQVENFYSNLSETAYQIYVNPLLPEAIAQDISMATNSRAYDTVRSLNQFFLSVYNQSRIKNIIGMYIIRHDGKLLGNFFPAYYPYYADSYYSELLQQARNNENRPMIFIQYESEYNQPVIHFLYPVRYRGEPSGLMVIDVEESGFRRLVESYNEFYRGEIMLVSPDNHVIYCTNPEKTGLHTAAASPASTGEKSILIETPYSDSGWRILYRYQIDPEQSLYRNLALATIAFSGLLAVIISFGLSYNLTKPIIELHRKMGRIQIGDYGARAEVLSKDEIGYLSIQFNKMAETVQQMIEHDLKLRLINQAAQIKALQAQISPHFLFNTLQMISGIAEANKMMDLKLICQSLGNMYRYNMNIDDEWVQLRDEIMHVRNYLVVINKRYSGMIRFRLHIEPEAYNLWIPKLILQPIFENAVEHGLIPGKRRRKLLRMSVRVDESHDMLLIYVIDNGSGMDNPEAIDLNMRINGDPVRKKTDQTTDSPIGLANVHTRIRLLSGHPFGITLTSRKDVGFCVTYCLPLKKTAAST